MSLLRAREAVMKNFIPHLRERDLSPQQWRVLRALLDAQNAGVQGREMTALAEDCYLLMPSLSRIVQNLEKRGLVVRKTAESDQRRSVISISTEGAQLVQDMAPQSDARYEHITNVFGYGKLELLYELLEELTDKLNAAEFSADDSLRESGDDPEK